MEVPPDNTNGGSAFHPIPPFIRTLVTDTTRFAGGTKRQSQNQNQGR